MLSCSCFVADLLTWYYKTEAHVSGFSYAFLCVSFNEILVKDIESCSTCVTFSKLKQTGRERWGCPINRRSLAEEHSLEKSTLEWIQTKYLERALNIFLIFFKIVKCSSCKVLRRLRVKVMWWDRFSIKLEVLQLKPFLNDFCWSALERQ